MDDVDGNDDDKTHTHTHNPAANINQLNTLGFYLCVSYKERRDEAAQHACNNRGTCNLLQKSILQMHRIDFKNIQNVRPFERYLSTNRSISAGKRIYENYTHVICANRNACAIPPLKV